MIRINNFFEACNKGNIYAIINLYDQSLVWAEGMTNKV